MTAYIIFLVDGLKISQLNSEIRRFKNEDKLKTINHFNNYILATDVVKPKNKDDSVAINFVDVKSLPSADKYNQDFH